MVLGIVFGGSSLSLLLFLLCLDFRQGRHAPEENIAFRVPRRELVAVGAEGEFPDALSQALQSDQLLPGGNIP